MTVLLFNSLYSAQNTCTLVDDASASSTSEYTSAPNQKRRPLFHANIPPKWWIRHLFHAFPNFG